MKYFMMWMALTCLLGAPATLHAGEIVDLNTVEEAEFADLPTGLPKSLARDIIRYRDNKGGFASPDDVKQVPGMDEDSFRTLYPFLLNGKVVVEVEMPKGVSPY